MAVQPLASQVGVAPACRALGVPRASFYRRQRPAPGHQQPRPTPARALCASERAHVLDVLASSDAVQQDRLRSLDPDRSVVVLRRLMSSRRVVSVAVRISGNVRS